MLVDGLWVEGQKFEEWSLFPPPPPPPPPGSPTHVRGQGLTVCRPLRVCDGTHTSVLFPPCWGRRGAFLYVCVCVWCVGTLRLPLPQQLCSCLQATTCVYTVRVQPRCLVALFVCFPCKNVFASLLLCFFFMLFIKMSVVLALSGVLTIAHTEGPPAGVPVSSTNR